MQYTTNRGRKSYQVDATTVPRQFVPASVNLFAAVWEVAVWLLNRFRMRPAIVVSEKETKTETKLH